LWLGPAAKPSSDIEILKRSFDTSGLRGTGFSTTRWRPRVRRNTTMDQQMSPHDLQTILQGLSADDIALKPGDPSKIYFIKGAVCASGMYDLYPASLSARNLYLNFHLDDTMTALSPILHIDNIHFPVPLGHVT